METSKEILAELGAELEKLVNLTKKKADSEYNQGLIAGLEAADKYINYFFTKLDNKKIKENNNMKLELYRSEDRLVIANVTGHNYEEIAFINIGQSITGEDINVLLNASGYELGDIDSVIIE